MQTRFDHADPLAEIRDDLNRIEACAPALADQIAGKITEGVAAFYADVILKRVGHRLPR
jgi:hypothetical protein